MVTVNWGRLKFACWWQLQHILNTEFIATLLRLHKTLNLLALSYRVDFGLRVFKNVYQILHLHKEQRRWLVTLAIVVQYINIPQGRLVSIWKWKLNDHFIENFLESHFYAAQLVPAGTAEARISYGISVCLSVCLSRPGTDSIPDEIETPGLHHMIA